MTPKRSLPPPPPPPLPCLADPAWSERTSPIIRCTIPGVGQKDSQSGPERNCLTQEYLETNYPKESWTLGYTDGSAENAVRNGGVGVYIQYAGGKEDKISLATAYTPQTAKLKQKPRKQQQPILKSALMLPPILSSLRTPCPSCRPSSQIGTLNSTTCLLLLPHFADAMQSPYNGYHPIATCLAMRLLTLWQRMAQQKSKWIGPPATLR